MSYPSLEAIRQSCLAIQQGLVDADQGIPVIETDEFEPSVGKAKCEIDCDTKVDAGITRGCRNNTIVSSTGCPLRNGVPVKVGL